MSRRLYDLTTRIALYVERTKTEQTLQFNVTLQELSRVLRTAFSKLKYSSLDQMTKAQLNVLLADLRASQTRIFSQYSENMIKQLRAFMEADLYVNKRVLISAYIDESSFDPEALSGVKDDDDFLLNYGPGDVTPIYGLAAIAGSSDRLWASISNAPIQANGLYLAPFIKGFTASAQAGIENMIRKAWANKQTVEETVAELTGESRQGTASQIDRIRVQGAAVTHTAQAHVSAAVAAAVASALFARYMWVSIIDGSTTDVCRHRNRRIFRYGEGPQPPAHIRCRSHTTPVGSSDIPDETLYTWLLLQPPEVQDDLLGEEVADELRNGRVNSRNFREASMFRPMTFEQFRDSVNRLLTR